MKKGHLEFFRGKNEGQMITLMGITLTLSVVILGSLAAEISDSDFIIPNARSDDLPSEFIHLKNAFGLALNYNLVDIGYIEMTDVNYPGDIYGASHSYPDISTIVTQTSNSFRGIELLHDKIFSATYESIDYAYLTSDGNGHVYYARIRLALKDSTGLIVEPVIYLLTIEEPVFIP